MSIERTSSGNEIERMKKELRRHYGRLDWYLTNRQVRRMHAEMVQSA